MPRSERHHGACDELQARVEKICEGDGESECVTSLVETALKFFTEKGFKTSSPEEIDTFKEKIKEFKEKIKEFLMKVLKLQDSSQPAECLMQSVHARFYGAIINKVKELKFRGVIIDWWTELWNEAEYAIYTSRSVSNEKSDILKKNMRNSLQIMQRRDRCEPSVSGACVIS